MSKRYHKKRKRTNEPSTQYQLEFEKKLQKRKRHLDRHKPPKPAWNSVEMLGEPVDATPEDMDDLYNLLYKQYYFYSPKPDLDDAFNLDKWVQNQKENIII